MEDELINIEDELIDIENDVLSDEHMRSGSASFDPWCYEEKIVLYYWLVENFKKKGINCFKGVHGDYVVSFHGGSSGLGNMGSPDSVIVSTLITKT